MFYDKAKYHYQTIEQHGLSDEHAAFPVQEDQHLLSVLRYVEAMRAEFARVADGVEQFTHA